MKKLTLVLATVACFIVCCGFTSPSIRSTYAVNDALYVSEIVVPSEVSAASSIRVEGRRSVITEVSYDWDNVIFNANDNIEIGDELILTFESKTGLKLPVYVTVVDMFNPLEPSRDLVISCDANYASIVSALLYYADDDCLIEDIYKLSLSVDVRG